MICLACDGVRVAVNRKYRVGKDVRINCDKLILLFATVYFIYMSWAIVSVLLM